MISSRLSTRISLMRVRIRASFCWTEPAANKIRQRRRPPRHFLGALALFAASCMDENGSWRSLGDAIGSPSATPTLAEAPLQFVLKDRYKVGEKIRARLRNDGRRPYIYNTAYEACDMRYFDESGRRFIIPPGTHCDIIANQTIEPGETVTLFKWKADECVEDRWGCVKAEPLEPGTYRIAGRFPPGRSNNGSGTASGRPVQVEAVFEIVASQNSRRGRFVC
jgi:hypothetical protein